MCEGNKIKIIEIGYAIKSRKLLMKTFSKYITFDILKQIINYVGFNTIQLNPTNLYYKYENYIFNKMINYSKMNNSMTKIST